MTIDIKLLRSRAEHYRAKDQAVEIDPDVVIALCDRLDSLDLKVTSLNLRCIELRMKIAQQEAHSRRAIRDAAQKARARERKKVEGTGLDPARYAERGELP